MTEADKIINKALAILDLGEESSHVLYANLPRIMKEVDKINAPKEIKRNYIFDLKLHKKYNFKNYTLVKVKLFFYSIKDELSFSPVFGSAGRRRKRSCRSVSRTVIFGGV